MAERLIDEVLDALLAIVESPDYGPGSALPRERALAERLGVSRAMVRQAFRVLEDRGLVTARQGSGRFVRDVDLDRHCGGAGLEIASIVDVSEVRVVLESAGAGYACERRSTAEAGELRARAMVLDGWQDNAAFHRALAAAAHNFLLARLVVEHVELARQLHQREHYAAETLTVMRDEHVAIADAVLTRDAPRARALMTDHLRGTVRAVLSPNP